MLQIGQKVSWCVSGCKMVGIVLEDCGNKVNIVTHLRDSNPHIQQMSVCKNLLTKI